MSVLQDFTVLASLFNFLSMAGNLFWSWRLSSFRGHGEMINYWKAENDKKDSQIKEMDERLQDMIKRKNEMKVQYHNLLVVNKKLEGEIATYKKFHNHPQL